VPFVKAALQFFEPEAFLDMDEWVDLDHINILCFGQRERELWRQIEREGREKL